jgi:hypothetical protein
MPLQYPLINGNAFDFSSVEITIQGAKFFGVKAISYKATLDPGIVRGNRAQVIGTTRGKYDAEGSIELYKLEFNEIVRVLSLLGFGFMEARFNIDVAFAEGANVAVDRLRTVRLKSHEDTLQEGNDPATVRCDLHIMYLQPNGADPLAPTQMLK